jgi:glycosyltransferase involved in cell wall biosynthesis
VPLLRIPRLRMLSFFINALRWLPSWCRQDQPDVLYERFSLTSLATLWVSRVLKIPFVVEVNGIVCDELALSRASRFRVRVQQWVEGRVFRGCDHLIAVTEGIRQWINARYAVALEKIDAIPNGTNPARFRPMDRLAARRAFGLDPAQAVVGYLGSLFPWSGLELLVEASPQVVAQVPDVLFVVGGGQPELKASLERRVRELGMDAHFHFAGDVPWDRAAEFISTFDLAVAPAKFADGRSGISPQKVYAYLACERPVIGSDIAGLGDLLETCQAGLSFPSGQSPVLAQAIVRLLQDKELARAMGQRGRRVILERFTWEQVVKNTMAICAALTRREPDKNRKGVWA